MLDTRRDARTDAPLCVDLDGTLIEGDSLRQAIRDLALRRPWKLVSPSLALLQGGRTAFKDALGHAHVPDPSTLSWRTAVLTYLLGQADAGRRLILATAAPSRFAECVAGHLGCFETVLSSNPHRNIKGERKVEAIRAHIGPIPFDYAGDSWTDLPVFAAARQGIVVSREEAFIRRVGELTRIEKIFRE